MPGTCHHSLYLTTPVGCHYPHFPDVEAGELSSVNWVLGWLASELEFHTGRLTPGTTPSDSFPEVASALQARPLSWPLATSSSWQGAGSNWKLFVPQFKGRLFGNHGTVFSLLLI